MNREYKKETFRDDFTFRDGLPTSPGGGAD